MTHRACLVAGSFIAVSLTAAVAQAEPETHDGFFLRLGANVGPGSVSETIEVGGTEGPEASFSGLTFGFDLMLGGTPAPGLVIGGALLTTTTSDPSFEQGSVKGTADGTLLMAGVAAFANYYFDPTQGLHGQLILGYGAVDFVRPNGASGGGNDPTGLLAGLGVGYDFWLGGEWSVGPFARVLYGSMGASAGSASSSVTYLYPSIGAAFTLH